MNFKGILLSIGGTLLVVAITLASMALWSVVVQYGWSVVMVPFGLPEISFVWAFGLAYMSFMFSPGKQSKEKTTGRELIEASIRASVDSVIKSLTCWAAFYVIHFYI